VGGAAAQMVVGSRRLALEAPGEGLQWFSWGQVCVYCLPDGRTRLQLCCLFSDNLCSPFWARHADTVALLLVAHADGRGTVSSRYPAQPAASESSDDTTATVRRIHGQADKWVVHDNYHPGCMRC
jgi:hypothetical protein